MKIEQIIVSHLYNNKKVTLQGMGTFHLDPTIVVTANNDKTISFPENAITFEYDAKAVEDASLINAIVLHTKKLKPLASADLESFINWQKQLLNINMPFTLPDVGLLQKDFQGQLVFVPQKTPPSKSGTVKSNASQKKEVSSVKKEIDINKVEEFVKLQAYPNIPKPRFSFHNFKTIANENKKKLISFVTVICIALIMLALYQIFISQKSDKKADVKIAENKTPAIAANDNIILYKKRDTLKPLKYATPKTQQNINNTYIFKIVFLKTKIKVEAQNKVNDIYGFGHSANLYIEDSAYKVAIPFNRPATDTSIIKDSLNKFYSLGDGTIELNRF